MPSSFRECERDTVRLRVLSGGLQEVTDFQESLRGAVNVVGPLENIPCRIEGLVEDGAEFIEGVAHSLEAWPAAKCDFKDVVKDALVLNKERELVEQVVGENNSLMSVGVGIKLVGNKERELVEQVVGEINSLMGAGVGNGLVGLNEERELVEKVVGENNSLMSGEVGNRLEGRAEVECDFIPCNIETTSHLPNIKEVHAKSYLAFNAGQARSLDRLGGSCGSGPVHKQEHSGMWEFANSVHVGLQGVIGGGGLAETKVVGTLSDVVGQRVDCDGGSGDRRLEVMVPEGECEGGFPSVGVTRVEPEEVRILEVNEVIRSMTLASGKEMGIEEVKSDVATLQFDDPNLVDT
ncbi:hypothetical protein ACSQ67_021287 [Phaseolus vulgaris]